MKHSEINKQFTEIKNLLKDAKITQAIEKLEPFTSFVDDDELEDQRITISSRFSHLKNKENSGTLSSDDVSRQFSEIIRSLMNLLRAVNLAAIEKATMVTGTQLSEIAEKGSSAIEELKRLNLIMAESRLLELQVMRGNLGSLFSEEQQERIDKNITLLKNILNRQDDVPDYSQKDSSIHFFSKIQEVFSGIMPDVKPTSNEIFELIKPIIQALRSESEEE